MNDVARLQASASGELGVAGRATAEAATLSEYRVPAGALTRSVHTATAEQCGIGCIDDRIEILIGDVTADQFDAPRDVGHFTLLTLEIGSFHSIGVLAARGQSRNQRHRRHAFASMQDL